MAYNFKEVMNKPERLAPGHRMCAGCGGTITVRTVLRALHEGDKAVIGNATGCLEVSTFMYPYTAYEDSYIHNAFENAGATLSGVETAYNVLKKKGKIDDTYKFITFGGDGGTYDIGLQSLSGAMERGHDMVYVCYDNGAYMNTGIQRSSATPMYADTTTTPVGSQSNGKMQNRKDLAQVMAAHDIPYVGQSTLLGNMRDLYEKAEKAIYTPGAAFLNVMSPCLLSRSAAAAVIRTSGTFPAMILAVWPLPMLPTPIIPSLTCSIYLFLLLIFTNDFESRPLQRQCRKSKRSGLTHKRSVEKS